MQFSQARQWTLGLAVALALGVAACQAAPPKFEHRTAAGLARSDDQATARKLATMATALAAKVCAALDVEREPPFVIHHVPAVPLAAITFTIDREGRIDRRGIEIGERGVRDCLRFSLAHELVHWYARGVWDRLPHPLREGLADYIGLNLAPETRATRQADYDLLLAGMTPERRARALAVTERTWMASPEDVRSDAHAVGFQIVSRYGIVGLRALCVFAEAQGLEHVPIEWLEPPSPALAAMHVD